MHKNMTIVGLYICTSGRTKKFLWTSIHAEARSVWANEYIDNDEEIGKIMYTQVDSNSIFRRGSSKRNKFKTAGIHCHISQYIDL